MKNILLTLMVFGSFAAFAEDALKTSNDSNSILVDVRTNAEWNDGYIETAIHIPLNELIEKIELIAKNKELRIYLYCRSGNRSGKAEQALQNNGYINARNIGGINEASSKLQLKIIKK